MKSLVRTVVAERERGGDINSICDASTLSLEDLTEILAAERIHTFQIVLYNSDSVACSEVLRVGRRNKGEVPANVVSNACQKKSPVDVVSKINRLSIGYLDAQ